MTVLPTRLPGLILVQPQVHSDERGFFVETYRSDRYPAVGIPAEFVQDNHSRSGRGTVRGLHFQAPPGQVKLVRVARGTVFDVVVDLRRSSSHFGEWEAFTLDDRQHLQLYVPVGFAHGFCVVSATADVVYKVSTYYAPELERGLAWDDPDLAIPWPVTSARVSPRDRDNPRLGDLKLAFD